MPVARRVSIGLLMVVVGLVAADFAIVRGVWNSWEATVAIITLPMINILILAAPRLRRVNPTRPFWLGFEVVGGLTVPVVGWLAYCPTDVVLLPIGLIAPLLDTLCPEAQTSIVISIVVLSYPPVLLLPALIAGRLSARYRLVIVRR